MEKISIIVPVYNAVKYLEKCVISLINQTYRNKEIILIDDGSTDGSGELCDKLAKSNENIRVIHQENLGVSTARNRGLGYASGKYIGFCDADDIAHPRMYEILINTIIVLNADLSCCECFRRDEQEIFQATEYDFNESMLSAAYGNEMFTRVDSSSVYQGYLCNKLFRREIIERDKKLRLDEDIFILEDLLFLARYLNRSKIMGCVNLNLYFYRHNKFSATHQKLGIRRLSSIVARERLIDLYREYGLEDYHIEDQWKQLMRCYAIFFKKLLLSSLREKEEWKQYIVTNFLKYKDMYSLNFSWSVKEKVYLKILIIYSYFFKGKGLNFE